MRRSEYLMDVVVIRLLLIFLLIFVHAFAIYLGSWKVPFDGFDNHIPLYFLLGYMTHGFRLEAMVFISGLLFGYAVTKYPERLCFNGCVTKKAKRILIPSLLFSIVYYLMFYDIGAPWYAIIYNILNGSGHMWFLPMIFWCFVLCYLLTKFTPPTWQGRYILLASVAMNLIAIRSIPFGVGHMMAFFVFFYLGFAIKRGLLRLRVLKNHECLLLILFYLSLMVANYYTTKIDTDGLLLKGVKAISMRLMHFLGAMSMTLAIFSLANNTWLQARLKRNDFLITISGYCYGVYIYHQFIERYLFYKTVLPHNVSSVALPWIVIIITLVLSLIFCHLTLKTRFGRYLIG